MIDFSNYTIDTLSPIYDCGSCLYPQLADEQLENIMNSEQEIEARIFKFPTPCLSNAGKKVSYYEFMCSGDNSDLSEAILGIVPKIDMRKIEQVIDRVSEIADIRKKFYKFILKERYEKILVAAFEKVSASNHSVFLNEKQTAMPKNVASSEKIARIIRRSETQKESSRRNHPKFLYRLIEQLRLRHYVGG